MENMPTKLYNILRTKFNSSSIKTTTAAGKETTDPDEYKMFSFDFVVNNKNYGPVVVSITEQDEGSRSDTLEIYYGDNTSRRLPRDAKKVWDAFITQMGKFARNHSHGFNLNHTSDVRYDIAKFAAKVNADVTESFKNIFESYYGTSKTSYNPQGKARIIIKHSKKIGEEDKRFRNISSLFIENAEGERFKMPFTKLAGARAMARHIQEGGNPYDLFGVHICEMVKNINTLGGFVRRSKMFETDEATSGLVETGRTHYASLRKGLKQIAGKRGYHTFKESWKPEEITALDEDTDAIRALFTERSLNEKVSDALPLLVRLQKMAEATPPEGSTSIENRSQFKYGDRVESIANPGGVYEVVATKGDKVKVQSDSDMTYTVDASSLRHVVGETSDEGEWNSAMGYDQDDPEEMIGRPDDCEACNATGMVGDSYCTACDGSGLAESFNMAEADEFESWANEIVEGPESPVNMLRAFFGEEQVLGIDAMNVADDLLRTTGSEGLINLLKKEAAGNPDQDARPIVQRWIRGYEPELAHQLNFNAGAEVTHEGLDKDLDADSDIQLNASINKDLDKHVNEDDEDDQLTNQFNETGDNMNKLFTEYVAEAEEALDETEVVVEDDYDDGDDDMCPHCDKPMSRAEMMGDHIKNCKGTTSDLDEATVEVGEPSGPIVTMESDDLSSLMQRTNHLLNK